ncbi:MAG TPA: hypothetical protein VGH87_27125 [Polyangiaceae bacterium]
MRKRATFPLFVAVLLTSATALADDKAACFDASEKAQKLKNDKKLSDARQQFIICARELCPQVVRVECAKSLTEVESGLSTVVVRARDADGKDLIDVKVYVDGNLLLPKLQGTAVPMDPGAHKFRYEFPDGRSYEEDVLIAEGEKDRVIRAELKGESAGGSHGGVGGGGGGGGVGGGETHSGGGAGPVPWIIGGVGVVSLGVFIGLQVDAQGTYSNLKNGCGVTKTCDPGTVSSLGTEFGVSGVFLAIGAAALVTGVAWIVVAAVSGHKNAEKAVAVFTPSGLKF